MDIPAIARLGHWSPPRPSARALGLAAVAVLVVAALGAGAWLWSEAQARRAEAAYAGPLARLSGQAGAQPGPDRDQAVTALEAALAQYPTSALASLAAYELGNVRFAERQFAKARALYDVAAARAESPTVRALARIGAGYTWEAERNFAKAAEVYQTELAAAAPGSFQYADVLLNLARVQAAGGRKDDAVATYRRFLKDVPGSPRAEEVRSRLAQLGAAP